MVQKQQSDGIRQLVRVRYADEWVGILVLLALVILLGAVIEAGVLRDWLTPAGRLRIVLPENGVSGLSVGDDLEVMGIHAGTVRRVRINPAGGMYAIAEIDPDIEPYIRRDSTAIIRRRFVVAGASYIDISRGVGDKLDWSYAVLSATNAPNPADTITQTFSDIRDRVIPVLDNAQHMMATLDATITDMHAGKGSIGRLMTNDDLIRQAEQMITSLNATVSQLTPIEKQLGTVMERANASMTNVQKATGDLSDATPAITRNLKDASQQLPVLLVQAQTTAASLQKLVDQMRGLWILGGSGSKTTARHARLSPQKVQP
ncbi:ABC transporter substrate-binding protein [Komagataeibacter rhaeticus]|uniref:MCE family protein n=1 Tax=Komagataeibacter rhaeticus TaxID=215221 RepID=A0A181C943_9PROT|nr:MlaD family protein [Komagataeibacter rhaeticus]ATU72239.1 MCE family protein [Komagataeibacter xylinus]EGG75272.1 putative ABC transporter substrate-binding protein [Gluconacetobacter sp. SXCC-1]KDU97210.1 ABC transporter substrate-binding protein [Komagataeibacter rhaeticus AF1]MBL7239629.1 MCE family protein [Komagataeibacter rhaeticus]MDT8871301.1 MlaD family protein [Komagataeibacter rhaeticus]